MRLLFIVCIGLLLTQTGQAQERVRNVRIRVTDSSQLEIRYDLVNARPGDSIYVQVTSRLRGSLRVLPEFVRGDVGKRVVAGADRRIVWDALANGYSLNEEVRATVLVKVGLPVAPQPPRPAKPVAVTQPDTNRPAVVEKPKIEKPKPADPVAVTPVPVTPRPTSATVPAPVIQPPARPGEPVAQPGQTQPNVSPPTVADTPLPVPAVVPSDTVAPKKKRYTGPAWAILSAVAPGLGNIFVQTPKPRIGMRPLVAMGCYALVVYGLQERQKAREVYTVYNEQKNTAAAEPYYQTANTHYHRYYFATRGAIVVAAADVILTFFKGVRNGRATVRDRPLQPVTLRPGLQAGQPTAVLRYSF